MPKYEVVCTNYQLIPGFPINKNQLKHTFENGASQQAIEFYSKVVNSEFTKIMAPVEVHLKRRGKTIQFTQYGPVDDFKNGRISS